MIEVTIVSGDLYNYCRPKLNATDECTLEWNCYKTFPFCKGDPPRQILGSIPPHTPPSVPLLMWNPPHGRVDSQRSVWHTHTCNMHHAKPSRMSTLVAKPFDWHYTHFTSSQWWAVMQINKPTMFWSSTCHNICDKCTLLKLRQNLTREFCCYAFFSWTIFLKNALM